MNKITKILFSILLTLSFSYVKADCTPDEINKLKEEADKIEITYKHLGAVETYVGTDYSQFEVEVNNLTEDLYILIEEEESETIKLTKTDNKIKLVTGTSNLNVYSNKCNVLIDSMKVKLPRFNIYSLEKECENIDSEEFPLCGKYYEYDVSYDTFKSRLKTYLSTHDINKADDKKNNKKSINEILKKVYNYIVEYKNYILIGIFTVALIIFIYSLIKKKKKRGVLK